MIKTIFGSSTLLVLMHSFVRHDGDMIDRTKTRCGLIVFVCVVVVHRCLVHLALPPHRYFFLGQRYCCTAVIAASNKNKLHFFGVYYIYFEVYDMISYHVMFFG